MGDEDTGPRSLFERHPHQVITFYLVADALGKEATSFAEAARQHHLHPPNINRALDELEDEHGDGLPSLFLRSPGGGKRVPRLSRDGKDFLKLIAPFVGPLVEGCEEFARGPQTSEARIAAHQAVTEYCLLPAIAEALRADSPLDKARIRLLHRATSGTIEAIRTWEVAWGIVSGDQKALEAAHPEIVGEGFEYEWCLRFPTMLFLPPDPGAAGITFRGPTPTMAEVAGGPLVLIGGFSQFRRRLDDYLKGTRPSVRFELDSGAAVIAAVNQGLGMAIVHQITIPPETQQREPRRMVDLSHLFGENELGILRLKGRKLPDHAERLRRAVKRAMRGKYPGRRRR